jgi:ribosomal protein S18 acetylase RimI-like enzyme
VFDRVAKLVRRVMKRRKDWSTATMRLANGNDAARVAALLVDAYRSWAKLGLNPNAASYTATDVVADLAYKEVWLLEHEGALVGTVTLRTLGVGDQRSLYVTHLATPTAIHGRGLGSHLMDSVEHLALDRDIRDVRLDTAIVMTELIAFYQRRGYAKFGERNHWEGTNYESQHYQKRLTPPVPPART